MIHIYRKSISEYCISTIKYVRINKCFLLKCKIDGNEGNKNQRVPYSPTSSKREYGQI
jgi:hypothetical protein